MWRDARSFIRKDEELGKPKGVQPEPQTGISPLLTPVSAFTPEELNNFLQKQEKWKNIIVNTVI